MAAVLLDCASAYAQVGASRALTSPLGMGPRLSIGQTGIPLGATELATPGVSPGATCGGAAAGASAGIGTSMTGGYGTTLFDGGGMNASTSGTCAAMGPGGPAGTGPMATSMGPGSAVGRAGIPMGATELGGGGLSPPSVALSPNPTAPLMSLTPLVQLPSSNPSPPVSTTGNATACQTSGSGVPGAGGVAVPFGTPLSGRALGAAVNRCEGG